MRRRYFLIKPEETNAAILWGRPDAHELGDDELCTFAHSLVGEDVADRSITALYILPRLEELGLIERTKPFAHKNGKGYFGIKASARGVDALRATVEYSSGRFPGYVSSQLFDVTRERPEGVAPEVVAKSVIDLAVSAGSIQDLEKFVFGVVPCKGVAA